MDKANMRWLIGAFVTGNALPLRAGAGLVAGQMVAHRTGMTRP